FEGDPAVLLFHALTPYTLFWGEGDCLFRQTGKIIPSSSPAKARFALFRQYHPHARGNRHRRSGVPVSGGCFPTGGGSHARRPQSTRFFWGVDFDRRPLADICL